MYKLKNSEAVSLKAVSIRDSFWSSYIDLIHNVVIPYQWEALNNRIPDAEPSHAIKNYKIAAGMEQGEFYGCVFQDSDVAKWLEAVGFSLAIKPNSELEKIADEVIDIIGKAQQNDGYMDTYFILKEPNKRWTNLAECHELYCAGHFIEGAVAYYNATGKRKIFEIACRLADCIDRTLGPEEGKLHGYDGHEEIELALVKLYKVTGNEKYITLAKYFLDERGKEPFYFDLEWEKRGKTNFYPDFRQWGRKYSQTDLPIREQQSAEGHAVRQVYLCMAMADVAAETGDLELFKAAKRLWENIIAKRMYITGAIGSMSYGESFSFDYDLPNDTVYGETCASIGLALFAHRMLKIEADSSYGDVLERELYNTIIAGMSLDGKRFFYVNPLEVLPEACEKNATKHHVKPTRQKWFGCSCCPPNIARTIASLGQYIYTFNEDTIYTHLYIGGETKIKVDKQEIILTQSTNYPWDGKVIIKISAAEERKFNIGLRIPGWCSNTKLKVNDEHISIQEITDKGYSIISRNWKNGDEIELNMDMPVLKVRSNPRVRENIGKAALQRGPIVYCIEEEDNGADLHQILLPKEAEFKVDYNSSLLGGVAIISTMAEKICEDSFGQELYKTDSFLGTIPVNLRFIPYYSWANRNIGEMMVWIREK